MFIMIVSLEQSCKGGVEVSIISHLKYGTGLGVQSSGRALASNV